MQFDRERIEGYARTLVWIGVAIGLIYITARACNPKLWTLAPDDQSQSVQQRNTEIDNVSAGPP